MGVATANSSDVFSYAVVIAKMEKIVTDIMKKEIEEEKSKKKKIEEKIILDLENKKFVEKIKKVRSEAGLDNDSDPSDGPGF